MRIFYATVLVLVPLAGLAGDKAPLRTLTEQCEAALALSALPVHLREKANYYVLTSEGYELQGAADAGWSCIVARNHADSVIPQCFDEPGRQAILPKFLDEGERIAAGDSYADIRQETARLLEQGKYASPARPGLVYMMSEFNYIYAARPGRVIHVGPHVMFHAPNLSPEQVGNTLQQGMSNTGLPFLIDPGPHSYMISMVERAADSAQVESACEGQLPPAPAGTG